MPENRCIDAEALAAWADGGVSAAEGVEIEQHLSTCARCQAVLAAFVRSAPTPAVVIPFWSRRPVQWSALGLAAAAALFAIVWTGDTPAPAPQPEATIASSQPVAPPDSFPSIPTIPASPSFPPIPTIPSIPPIVKAPSTSVSSPKPVPAPRPPAPSPSSPSIQPIPASPTLPPIPTFPPIVNAPPPPQPTTVTVQAAAPMVDTRQTRVVSATPTVAREMVTDAFESIPVLTFEVVAPAVGPGISAGRAGGRGGSGGRAGGMVAGVAPPVAPPTRWRVIGGKTIERSPDGGATWFKLAIAPPVATVLTAGAASSQTVCWFVGRGGLVMLTADGVTAKRLSFPEAVDLVSVVVDAELRVIVTTADGRAFVSTDAGATWVPVKQ